MHDAEERGVRLQTNRERQDSGDGEALVFQEQPNYPGLAAVKAKYDPDGLFFVHHGVESEHWSDDGFTK